MGKFFDSDDGVELMNAKIGGNPNDGQKDERLKVTLSLMKPQPGQLVALKGAGYNSGMPDVSQCAWLLEVIRQWSRSHGGLVPFSIVDWRSQETQSYFQNASIALGNGLLSDTYMWIAVLYKHIHDYGGSVLENLQRMPIFCVNSLSPYSCVYREETAETDWRTFSAQVMRIVESSNSWDHQGDKIEFLERVMDILLSKLQPILEERVYPMLSTGSGITPGTTFTTFVDAVSAALRELGRQDPFALERVLARQKELTGATTGIVLGVWSVKGPNRQM
jgi:hypothetical protein